MQVRHMGVQGIGALRGLGLTADEVSKLLGDMVGAPGAQTIVRGMSPPEKLAFMQQMAATMPLLDLATLAASIIGTQFKQSPTYAQFISAFKAALLKV